MLTKYQKDFIRTLNKPRTVYYFPRMMGKTYALKLTREFGKKIIEASKSNPRSKTE